jgi:hypothetical protein
MGLRCISKQQTSRHLLAAWIYNIRYPQDAVCAINADSAITSSACVTIEGKQHLETDLWDIKCLYQKFLRPGKHVVVQGRERANASSVLVCQESSHYKEVWPELFSGELECWKHSLLPPLCNFMLTWAQELLL